MLKLSKTIQYGLRSLRRLVHYDGPGMLKIDEIARSEKIPEQYLRKLFQTLIKNGIVESGLGPKGGVRLAPGAGDIALAEIIILINGPLPPPSCTLFGDEGCAKLNRCPLQLSCNYIQNDLWEKLRKFTLNDLNNQLRGTTPE